MPQLKIRDQILIVLVVINLIASAAFTWTHYRDLKVNIIDGVDKHLYTVVYGAVNLIPATFYDRITDAHSVTPEEHLARLKLLSRYAEQTHVTYLYAYMQFNGEIVTVATSALPEQLAAGEYEPFFKPYKTAGYELKKVFATRQPHVGEYQDEYGRFRTLFLPLTSANGSVYVVGADVAINFVQERLNTALRSSLLIGGAVFLVSFLLIYLVIDRLITPLVRLTQFTHTLGEHDFIIDETSNLQLHHIIQRQQNEIGQLAQALQQMAAMLMRYLERIRMTTAAEEREAADLRAAYEIQMGLLPIALPVQPHFEIYATIEPAKAVGGDVYDYRMLDAHTLFFMIGDVSGKGVPAALFMAVTKTLFKAHAQSGVSIDDIMRAVNADLVAQNPAVMFVTVFAALLDVNTGELEYCDAGHEIPLIYRHADRQLEPLEKRGGMALGLMPDYNFVSSRMTLAPHDTLLLFTDGVNEAMNEQRQLFGIPRLMQTFAQVGHQSPPQVVKDIVAAVHEYADSTPQSDDITVLALCLQ